MADRKRDIGVNGAADGALAPVEPCCELPVLEARGLHVRAGGRAGGGRQILRDVELLVGPRRIVCLVGPSGAGKTTLLRCFNRLIDLSPGLAVRGGLRVLGEPVYARGYDVDRLRSRVGMLFQQPVIFPGSVEHNVRFGLRHRRDLTRRAKTERVERALRGAALWDEVKDRLAGPAVELSVGQQQRLCLARALALDPEVLLMDEPTSALDPRATEAIEELVLGLKARRTVLIVTHDVGQARRLADEVACLAVRDGAGELVECGPPDEVLERPRSAEMTAFLGRAVGGGGGESTATA